MQSFATNTHQPSLNTHEGSHILTSAHTHSHTHFHTHTPSTGTYISVEKAEGTQSPATNKDGLTEVLIRGLVNSIFGIFCVLELIWTTGIFALLPIVQML